MERSLIVLADGTRVVVKDSVEDVGVMIDCAMRYGERFTLLPCGTLIQVVKVLAVVPWTKEPSTGQGFQGLTRPSIN